MTKSPISGHNSQETAYLIADYPYSRRERCQKRVWLEHSPKRGYRLASQTTNPKTGHWNKPQVSTYIEIAACMYLDEQCHIQWSGIGVYSDEKSALDFVRAFGSHISGLDTLAQWASQKAKYYNQLASGQAYFTINSERCEVSEAELSGYAANAKTWEDIAFLAASAKEV